MSHLILTQRATATSSRFRHPLPTRLCRDVAQTDRQRTRPFALAAQMSQLPCSRSPSYSNAPDPPDATSHRVCGIRVHRTGLRCTSVHRLQAATIFCPDFYPRDSAAKLRCCLSCSNPPTGAPCQSGSAAFQAVKADSIPVARSIFTAPYVDPTTAPPQRLGRAGLEKPVHGFRACRQNRP